MARHIFNLPDIGEGISEAEIVAWHAKPGDMVEEDGRIADMMTDKATVEMEAHVSGRLVEIAGDVGDIVSIGSMLFVIETEGEGAAIVEDAAPAMQEARNFAPENDPAPEPLAAPEPAPAPPSPPAAAQRPAESPKVQPEEHRGPVLASPAVRKRARDLGIDLADVQPQGDRVRHGDLDAYLTYGRDKGYRPAGAVSRREDEQVKVIGLRRRIAENMAASKRNIPHFTYVEEIDVTKLEAMRADLNAERGDRPKLTMLPFLIVALCRAIPDYPMVNAHYDDEAGIVTRYGAVHMGMAAQTPSGLMVPVIRDAQEKNVWQLAREITRLSEAARNGTAKSSELSGSTITLSSLGAIGGLMGTPVINRPETAIIGVHRIIERPVINDGEIAAAKLMNLSISCDHRVVDGWDAASFMQAIRRLLETPVLLFSN